MLSFFKKREPKPRTAWINGQAVAVAAKETLLQAALRENIEFPHNCRVGGCASCKCRLVEGQVRELTDAGYILSDEDLDNGYILACQSVPTTDVKVELVLNAQRKQRSVLGRIIHQDKLTPDITRLTVQLEEGLAYQAGQYADLTLESLPELRRSFSFATPQQGDATLTFFIRQVPGGQFTTMVNDHNLLNQRVTVQGPIGEFYLREAQSPLLMIAGGSGLAPILAMLSNEVSKPVHRPVTLLFGARTQRDLYALDDIHQIQKRWQAPFEFIPVLSEEPADSSWSGARGLVTDCLPQTTLENQHAYLCGPPGMIDATEQKLLDGGIRREHLFSDRFITAKDVAERATSASLS